MTDSLPDRLAIDPANLFYDATALEREIGITLNGVEKTTVEEYCISEGWVRVAVGKTKDRFGKPMTIKLKGVVLAYYKKTTDQTETSA